MRRKIVLSLMGLFACSASGAGLAVAYIHDTTATIERIVTLHRIEAMRQDLVITVQTAKADLYTARTPLGRKPEAVSADLSRMEEAAAECRGCHHAPAVSNRIQEVQSLVGEYRGALNDYLGAGASPGQAGSARLQREADAVGEKLLRSTEEMSRQASTTLQAATASGMRHVGRARLVLWLTIGLSLALGAAVAFNLIGSVTRPIDALVRATRAIAAGDLGYTIAAGDPTEFGELAANFNAMSTSLHDGYLRLQAEVEERRLAEAALRASEERYALAARGANDGLWDWDLDGGRIYFSQRWKEMLGHADGQVSDDPEEWFGRVHPDDRAELRARIAAHVEGHSPSCESEYRIQHADGSYLWVVCRGIAVRSPAGRAHRLAGSQTDITARKRAEQQLAHDALHDVLTGLPNRTLLVDRLSHVIVTGQRHPDQHYAVLFLDLDRFKVVNDSLGHMVGDALLVAVGRRLIGCVRPRDTVARLGGDEFAVLLEEVDGLPAAVRVVERIGEQLAPSFEVEGHEIFATASIGVAMSAPRYECPEQVLRDADVAMYQAKIKGRACYEIFDAQMHGKVLERLRLEGDLRRAVEHGREFLLHYQPIVELAGGRLAGVEALIRWREPRRGLISPGEFIPLAEESGLIVAVGDWVLRAACEQMRAWRGHQVLGSATMGLNVSARQFRRPDMVDRFARTLCETDAEPGHIAVELTESAIMEDAEASAAKLGRLRDMGIQVHVDDFGTGYSSLSYLHRFPITAVKVASSFVSRLSTPGEGEALIRAIVSIAENLGFEVIAEGVEEGGQLATLRRLGCRFAQGFFFARPLEADSMTAWAVAAGGAARPP